MTGTSRCALLLVALAGCALAGCALAGCHDLDDAACAELRSRAFELLNTSHVCREDADCWRSEWPGCPRPLNRDARARLSSLQERFERGRCQEPPASCRDEPEVYCDRQFCVFRYRGGAAP